MAHSDTLIFLTNISWIFFLFLLSYFFFVLFFLPTFYKKVRARTLIRAEHQRLVLVLLSNSVVGTLLFICEITKVFFFDLVKLIRFLALVVDQLKILFFVKSLTAKSESIVVDSRGLGGFWLEPAAGESRKLVSFFSKLN